MLLTKKKSSFTASWKSKETAVKQTAGKAGQIIDQARVEDCLDGRSHRHQLACRQIKRKDRQNNIHLHEGAVLHQPGSRASAIAGGAVPGVHQEAPWWHRDKAGLLSIQEIWTILRQKDRTSQESQWAVHIMASGAVWNRQDNIFYVILEHQMP